MICCYKQDDDEEVQDLSSNLSQSNLKNNKYYQNLFSSNFEQQDKQKQILTLYGYEYFALLRKTFKNIFVTGDIQVNKLQKELIDFLQRRCYQIGYDLQIFIPYSDDQDLLYLFQLNKSMKITTIDDNIYYLEQINQQYFIKNIAFLDDKNQIKEYDIVILNCSDLNYKRLLNEMNWLAKCSKSFILIFDFNEKIEQLISQFMQYIEQIKGELLQISLNGKNKFYILFFGKVSATKSYSENATILELLLNDLPDQEIYQKPVSELLQHLKDKKISKQRMLKLIIKSSGQAKDEQNQQPDTQISIFIYWLLTEKLIDAETIKQIFGDLYISKQLSITAQLQQFSLTLNNFTLDPQTEDKTQQQTIRSQQHSISTIKEIIEND